MIGRSLLVALLPAASAAFDLSCHGVLTSSDASGSAERAFAMHVRLDLEAGRFCLDLCAESRPIADIRPDRIVFYSAGSGSDVRSLAYERRSSRLDLRDDRFADGKRLKGAADCTVSAFSGMDR